MEAQAQLRERLEAFKIDSKARHGVLARASADEQKRSLSGLIGVTRKAARSLAVLRAASLKAELTAALSIERQSLRETIYPAQAVAWGLFLQKRAQAGSEEALSSLRKLDNTARTGGPSITGIIQLDAQDEREWKRRLSVQAANRSLLNMLVHTVERNGDVTYRHHGRAVLRDEGPRIAVLDPDSDAAIEAALLMAQQKFGTHLSITGPAQFQQRVVAVAVAQGIAVEFVDPQLEDIRQQLAEEKFRAVRTPAPPPLQNPAAELSSSNESVKRGMSVAAVDATQIADAPTQRAVPSKVNVRRAATPPMVNKEAPQPAPAAPPELAVELLSAKDWITIWSAQTGKAVVSATVGDGATSYIVEYVGPDGIVLNKGRSGAVYPLPPTLTLTVGDRIVIGKNSQIHIPKAIYVGRGGSER